MSNHEYIVCGICGAPLDLVVLARWENGDIQEAEWRCRNEGGDHPVARGWYCDMGTLDLGLVTDEQLGSS